MLSRENKFKKTSEKRKDTKYTYKYNRTGHEILFQSFSSLSFLSIQNAPDIGDHILSEQ